jgi:hypothetical protein
MRPLSSRYGNTTVQHWVGGRPRRDNHQMVVVLAWSSYKHTRICSCFQAMFTHRKSLLLVINLPGCVPHKSSCIFLPKLVPILYPYTSRHWGDRGAKGLSTHAELARGASHCLESGSSCRPRSRKHLMSPRFWKVTAWAQVYYLTSSILDSLLNNSECVPAVRSHPGPLQVYMLP